MKFIKKKIKSLIKKIKKIMSKFYTFKKIQIRGFRMAHYFAYYYEKEKIRENYVFYSSQCGNTWNGNPLAILNYLLSNKKYNHLKHIVLYNNLNDFKVKEYRKKYKNIKFIKTGSKLYAKYAESCKYIFADNTLSPYFIKKDGQIYSNSWHSTLLKPLGKDTGYIWETSNISKNYLQVDYFISPNEFTSEKFFKAYYTDTLFKGEKLHLGYPRNDIMFNTNKESLRKRLGVTSDKKLIIYAPTWRGTTSNKDKESHILFEQFYKIREQLDDKYIFLFRPHIMTLPYISDKDKKYITPMDIETNELLSVTDILITDYSGILFDYLITDNPLIIFPFDNNDYLSNRDSKDYYIPLDKIPAPVCNSVKEVLNSIKNIESIKEKYSQDYKKFKKQFVGHDDGMATKRVVEYIFNKEVKSSAENDSRKKILICGGNLNGNGVTESFLTLLNNIDYKKYDVSVLIENKNPSKQLAINSNVNIFYTAEHYMYKNAIEYYFILFLTKFGYRKFLPTPKKFCIRNMKSRLGNVNFDIVIEYHGYNPKTAMIHSIGVNDNSKKIIYLHSDMNKDRIEKNKKIKSVFSFYRFYDKLVCVSKGSMQANINDAGNYINKKFKVNLKDRFTYVYNLINYKKIEQSLKVEPITYNNNKYYYCNKFVNSSNNLELIKAPNKDEISFISIGRLSPEKSHELLIKAFYKLNLNYNNLKLYIVGKGTLYKKLDNLIKKLGLEDKVVLTGYLSNPYILLNQCNCFLFPSKYEGMGLAVVEAETLGKYVIASNIDGVRDLVNKDNGILVNNTEKDFYLAMKKYVEELKSPLKLDAKQFNKNSLDLFYSIVEGK